MMKMKKTIIMIKNPAEDEYEDKIKGDRRTANTT